MSQHKPFSIIVTFNPDISNFEKVLSAHINTNPTGIVIIDNNSENKHHLKNLVKKYGQENIKYHFLDVNKGIGYAQNIGIKLCREVDCDYVLLFDQDTIVPASFIDTIIGIDEKLVTSGAKIGAIGPCHYDARTNNYYPLAKVNGINLKKIFPDKIIENHIRVSFLISSGSLIRMSTFSDVGLMNEELFIDGVDIEWCFRAAAKGYLFFACKELNIAHNIGDKRIKSLGREISMHSPVRKYYMMRNNLLICRFNWVPVGFRTRIILITIFRMPVYLYDVKFNIKYIRYMFKGIYDGILNKGGEYHAK